MNKQTAHLCIFIKALGFQDFRLRLDVPRRTAATPEKMALTVIMMVM